jgi:CheY-like chemotaxis protein
MPVPSAFGILRGMQLRCLIVDDSARFLESAGRLLAKEGVDVVGVAATSAEGLERTQELRPDVVLVDIDLGGESGFELARAIAEAPAPAPVPVILISTRSEDELAELVEVSPALGFLSKRELTGQAIRDLLPKSECVHEALLYSTPEELLAAVVPFVRDGLDAGEPVLVATKEANIDLLRESLHSDAGRVEFVDSAGWYREPSQTLAAYGRYLDAQLDAGAGRVRVVGELHWPRESQRAVADWQRYESAVNVAWASTPVWVVCPYDTADLPEAITAAALETHPIVRTGGERRSSARYTHPEVFVRELGLEVSELLADRPKPIPLPLRGSTVTRPRSSG